MSSRLRRLALWTACLAQLIVVLDVSVVNVALPSIQNDLGLKDASASWVAMAYSLGFAGILLVGARLADTVGTIRLLAWSAAAFTVASVIGGLSVGGWGLIAARAAQGVSAAALSPATFTLLTTTHVEGPERTKAITIWTAVSLAGGGLGNIASGLLTDLISWRATLLINLPIGALVFSAALMLRKQSSDEPRAERIDSIGAVLATAAFTCTAYALSSVGDRSSLYLAAVAGSAAVALFILLIFQQRHTPHKLVPLELSHDRTIVLGNFATALTGACFQVSLWYFLTYRMQAQFDYSPIQAGLAFIPLTVSTLGVNLWITPRLMKHSSPQMLIISGALLAVPGLIWLAITDSAAFSFAVLIPTLAVGIGGGLLNTPLATIVTTGVRPEHSGAASGLMNTAKQFGGAIGLATATAVVAATGTDGAAFVFMAAALIAVIVVVAGAQQQPELGYAPRRQ